MRAPQRFRQIGIAPQIPAEGALRTSRDGRGGHHDAHHLKCSVGGLRRAQREDIVVYFVPASGHGILQRSVLFDTGDARDQLAAVRLFDVVRMVKAYSMCVFLTLSRSRDGSLFASRFDAC